MLIETVTIQRFRNFVDPDPVTLEPDVTGLVGKNESGKSAFLHALFRLYPANRGYESKFDVTEEYPRWRLAMDRRRSDLDTGVPVEATFLLEDDDRTALANKLDVPILPEGTRCEVWRTYANDLGIRLQLPMDLVVDATAEALGVQSEDVENLASVTKLSDVAPVVKERVTTLKEQGETARAAALKKVPTQLQTYSELVEGILDDDTQAIIIKRLPRFFYFSNYAILPGRFDLTSLLSKQPNQLTPSEQTARALLSLAGVYGKEFDDDQFESRKAELEAAAMELTYQVFEYWKQNEDLVVDFDDDFVEVDRDSQGRATFHRFIDIRLKDMRHGGVSTNFSTRSSGFQWFFSFLAAFSEFEHHDGRVIVLLDEPGTSLHGDAQRDFLRFINERLGTSLQVVYTTHSQHMIEPEAYEKLRAVEDRADRRDPQVGAVVTPLRLSADADTLLPAQAALGYSINQHWLLGAYRHLLVEGGSDFVYLCEMSNHLNNIGRQSLDPTLSILPVGGVDKISPFVALLGRHLDVSVLMDGGKNSRHVQRINSLIEHDVFMEDQLVLCSQVPDTNASADIEDLFEPDDYVQLYNWAFDTELTAGDLPEPGNRLVARLSKLRGADFDHGLPAEKLAVHRADFLNSLQSKTIERFETLFALLNATLR